jgi:hypothetical protein
VHRSRALRDDPHRQNFRRPGAFLCHIGARTKGVLVETIGEALDTVSIWDAQGFFADCGLAVRS